MHNIQIKGLLEFDYCFVIKIFDLNPCSVIIVLPDGDRIKTIPMKQKGKKKENTNSNSNSNNNKKKTEYYNKVYFGR